MRRITEPTEIPQPYHALLALESRNSDRSVSEHLAHILSRRYDQLIRVCQCGFFIYTESDDFQCAECGSPCCVACGSAIDQRDYCASCAVTKGFEREMRHK